MTDKKPVPAKASLEEINVFPIPAGEVELTEDERALLDDPDWITEDESDIIVAERSLAEGESIPIEEYMRSRGYVVKR